MFDTLTKVQKTFLNDKYLDQTHSARFLLLSNVHRFEFTPFHTKFVTSLMYHPDVSLGKVV